MKLETWVTMGLLSLASLAMTTSAQAVSPAAGGVGSAAQNNVGVAFVNLTSSATTFCFLTRVQVEDTDSVNEFAGCNLTRGPLVWTLQAVVTASDAAARCTALCYNN